MQRPSFLDDTDNNVSPTSKRPSFLDGADYSVTPKTVTPTGTKEKKNALELLGELGSNVGKVGSNIGKIITTPEGREDFAMSLEGGVKSLTKATYDYADLFWGGASKALQSVGLPNTVASATKESVREKSDVVNKELRDFMEGYELAYSPEYVKKQDEIRRAETDIRLMENDINMLKKEIDSFPETFATQKERDEAGKKINEYNRMIERSEGLFSKIDTLLSEEKGFIDRITGEGGVHEISKILGMSLPTTAALYGVGIVTGGSVPALLATSYMANAGFAYGEAKEYVANSGINMDSQTEDKLGKIAILVGATTAPLDSLGFKGVMANKDFLNIKNTLIKNIVRPILDTGIGAVSEGGTEFLQEVISNAWAMTYDEHRTLLDNTYEAAFAGALMGGGTAVTQYATGSAQKQHAELDKLRASWKLILGSDTMLQMYIAKEVKNGSSGKDIVANIQKNAKDIGKTVDIQKVADDVSSVVSAWKNTSAQIQHTIATEGKSKAILDVVAKGETTEKAEELIAMLSKDATPQKETDVQMTDIESTLTNILPAKKETSLTEKTPAMLLEEIDTMRGDTEEIDTTIADLKQRIDEAQTGSQEKKDLKIQLSNMQKQRASSDVAYQERLQTHAKDFRTFVKSYIHNTYANKGLSNEDIDTIIDSVVSESVGTSEKTLGEIIDGIVGEHKKKNVSGVKKKEKVVVKNEKDVKTKTDGDTKNKKSNAEALAMANDANQATEEFVKAQGEPVYEKTLYRGYGGSGGLKAREDIGNALGDGDYYAGISQAIRYGKKVEEKVVKLKNPLFIRTDQDLRNITGGQNLIVSEKAGVTPSVVKQQIADVRQKIIDAGHDGVVIEMKNYQDTQNLRRLFEHDQVVDYSSQLKTKSQLTDIWNKANKATDITDPKNFNSADEFVKAQEVKSPTYAIGGGSGHTAPLRLDDATPIYKLDEIYPKDIYSDDAVRLYSSGNKQADIKAFEIINKIRNNPDADVVIYRATPKDVKDINAGDWVTLTREYAEIHGKSNLNNNYNIITKKVKADEIFTDANSIQEFGYDPRTLSKSQPIDIWNEAHDAKFKKKDLSSIKRNMTPDQAKKFVQSVFGDSVDARSLRGAFFGETDGMYSPAKVWRKAMVEYKVINGLTDRRIVFHEVFHAFLEKNLSKEEYNALIEKTMNSPLLQASLNTQFPSYETKREKAEEWLADDFARYVDSVMGNETAVYEKTNKTLYKKLLEVIRTFVRNAIGAQKIYSDILSRVDMDMFKDELAETGEMILRSSGVMDEMKNAREIIKDIPMSELIGKWNGYIQSGKSSLSGIFDRVLAMATPQAVAVEQEMQNTNRVDFLEDVKTRLKIDFDVYLVDTIIAGVKNDAVTGVKNVEAWGITLDNSIAIVKDAVKNTDKHEVVHLVLANAENIPVMREHGITKEKILTAQATSEGKTYKDLTLSERVEIEERVAEGYEAYKGGKQYAGIVGTFYRLLKQGMDAVQTLLGHVDEVQRFYDILETETAGAQEVVRIKNNGVLSSLIEDSVLDARGSEHSLRDYDSVRKMDIVKTKEVDPLIKEAQKYETLEEYVQEQNNTTKRKKLINEIKDIIDNKKEKVDVEQDIEDEVNDTVFDAEDAVNSGYLKEADDELLPDDVSYGYIDDGKLIYEDSDAGYIVINGKQSDYYGIDNYLEESGITDSLRNDLRDKLHKESSDHQKNIIVNKRVEHLKKEMLAYSDEQLYALKNNLENTGYKGKPSMSQRYISANDDVEYDINIIQKASARHSNTEYDEIRKSEDFVNFDGDVEELKKTIGSDFSVDTRTLPDIWNEAHDAKFKKKDDIIERTREERDTDVLVNRTKGDYNIVSLAIGRLSEKLGKAIDDFKETHIEKWEMLDEKITEFYEDENINDIKDIARNMTRSYAITSKGMEKIEMRGLIPKEITEKAIEYRKTKAELVQTAKILSSIRKEIAGIKKDTKNKKRILRDVERRLKAREEYLDNKYRFIEQGIRKARKEMSGIMGERTRRLALAKEYHGMTDRHIGLLRKGKSIRDMTDDEFGEFVMLVDREGAVIAEKRNAIMLLEATILERDFQKWDNLRQVLGLPQNISDMTAVEITLLTNTLRQYKKGDVFLPTRLMETLGHTRLEGLRTEREIREDASELSGKDIGMDKGIKEARYFKRDNLLRRASPLLDVIVGKFTKADIKRKINAQKNIDIANEAIKKARASRKRSVLERIIPTDKKIKEYMEATTEGRTEIAKMMTKEELEAAKLLSAMMYEYYNRGVAQSLERKFNSRFVGAYYHHTQRGFLEALKDDGFISAFVELLVKNKHEQTMMTILNGKTGDILPYEKFVGAKQFRSNTMKETLNVAQAMERYILQMENAFALDEMIPEVMAYTYAFSPKKETEYGVKMDTRLQDFVKEYINTKKGRPVKLVFEPGGLFNTMITMSVKIARMMHLGINIPTQIVSPIGEMVANLTRLGAKKLALGELRMKTKKGKVILEKYKGIIGMGLFRSFVETSNTPNDVTMLIAFPIYHASSYHATAQFVLASLTEEEYISGDVSLERMTEIMLSAGKYRKIEGQESIRGHSSEINALSLYRGWAIPLVNGVFTTAIDLTKMIKKDGINALKTPEAREMYYAIGVGLSILTLFGSLYDDLEDKDDRTVIEDVIFKAIREANTIYGAFDITMWTQSAYLDFIGNVANSLWSIITLERNSKGDFVGMGKLSKTLTPNIIKRILPDEEKQSVKMSGSVKKYIEKGNVTKETVATIAEELFGTLYTEGNESYKRNKEKQIIRAVALYTTYGSDDEFANVLVKESDHNVIKLYVLEHDTNVARYKEKIKMFGIVSSIISEDFKKQLESIRNANNADKERIQEILTAKDEDKKKEILSSDINFAKRAFQKYGIINKDLYQSIID